MFTRKDYSKGAAITCLKAHFPNLEINESDLSQDQANEVKSLLKKYQYNSLSERELDQKLMSLVKDVSYTKGKFYWTTKQ